MVKKRLAQQPTKPTTHPVSKRVVDPKGWQHALRLADQDPKRIVIQSKTEFLVLRPS